MQRQQSKSIQSLSFEELFQMADQKFEQLDYDDAQYFYSLAYNKNSANQAVIMCYANVLKQNQKAKQAKKILEKSIKENPNGTYKRYFELGQIYEGVDSIKCFQSGINQALKSLKNPFKTVTPQAQIKRDVSQAYACIAEVCLTDLINEPQAQAKCIQALQKGRKADPQCMDIHLQNANYQLYKQNQDAARMSLELILAAVKSKKQQYQNQLILQASKYYIELDQFNKSAQLLQVIHEQQSNQSQIVYLLAYCSFKLQRYVECQDYIEEYKDGDNNIKDEEIEEAMNELIVELKKVKPDFVAKPKKGNKQSHAMQQTGENADGEQQQNLDQNDDDEWMDVEDEN